MSAPLLAVDLDGVLAVYDGWHGPQTPIGPLAAGAKRFLGLVRARGWDVVAHSARDPAQVREWLRRHGLHLPVAERKPGASVFLDDRALRFTGDFREVLRGLEAARRPWWA